MALPGCRRHAGNGDLSFLIVDYHMALTAYHIGIIDMTAAVVILPANARPQPAGSTWTREVGPTDIGQQV
jgi:hypothetical protein